jgi:hypothetical protein
MTTQSDKITHLGDPRTLVIMAMYKDKKLNDETLPAERYKIFMEQPFSQWPPDMQTELAPFGAAMIQ